MIFSPGPLQASREVKDILVQCWLFNAKYVLIVLMMKINFDSRDRPDFPSLAQTLERLPKKRLARFSNQPLLLSNANSVRFLLLPANLHLMSFDLQISFTPNSSVAQCRGALLRSKTAFESRCSSFPNILDLPHPFPFPPVPL